MRALKINKILDKNQPIFKAKRNIRKQTPNSII